MFNGLTINPAYAGSQPQINATALYRKQWTNVAGSPNTQIISVHSQLKKRAKRNGLGLLMTRDEIGVHSQYEVLGMYSYRLPLSRKSALSMGLQAGFSNLRSDFTQLTIKDPNDPNFAGYLSRFKPLVGAGLYYYLKDKAYAGFSVPYMLRDNFLSQTDTFTKDSRYYLLTGGFVFNYSEKIKIKPSALLRMADGVPLALDISANIIFDDKIFVGATYRNIDAISLMAQWQMSKHLQVGYAYDITTSKLNSFSRGSHEIMINVRINHTREMCPTYF